MTSFSRTAPASVSSETEQSLAAKFASLIQRIAADHDPGLAPFFHRLRELRGPVAGDPEMLGQIYVVYQAAMHALRAGAYLLPHLDGPATRPRKLRQLVEVDGLPGGDSRHQQVARLFASMGARLPLGDEAFGSAHQMCRHQDPETARFAQLASTLYARSLGAWCVMETMAPVWRRAFADALSVHFPTAREHPCFADGATGETEERHAEEALDLTGAVLTARPELYSETVLDARLMADALDGVWHRLDTIVRLAEQRYLLKRTTDPTPASAPQPDLVHLPL
jgi:hypothetical protein